MGSTSYDEARDINDPTWSGASWYGPSSGEYWIVNPREYADPRKHGPEYQSRARRPLPGDAALDDAEAPTATANATEAPIDAPIEPPAAAPVATVDQPTAAYPLVVEPSPEPAPDDVPAVAGEVAMEVARQLTDPVHALRDRLGLVVDHLERHVATSTGPTPYPWRSLQTLRQDLAAAYLEATSLARRIDELDRALRDDPPGWFDPAAAVELGLHLAGHHLGAGIELLIDLGNTPPARGVPGTVALLVAQLVAASARSARDLPGSTVSVRVVGSIAPWSTSDQGWRTGSCPASRTCRARRLATTHRSSISSVLTRTASPDLSSRRERTVSGTRRRENRATSQTYPRGVVPQVGLEPTTSQIMSLAL